MPFLTSLNVGMKQAPRWPSCLRTRREAQQRGDNPMQCSHYHTGRTLAISVGVAATGGALAILLADPIMTGNWRLDHVLLPVIVAITIASGHLCGCACAGWRILPAMGFSLIFLVGTVLTVYSSVGAQKSGCRCEAGARKSLFTTMRLPKGTPNSKGRVLGSARGGSRGSTVR